MTVRGGALIREITVCGGGNGAHALIGALLLQGTVQRLRLYLPLDEERACFAAAVGQEFRIRTPEGERSASTEKLEITGDPREAARSLLIVMVVPAFAHEPILSSLAPYLTESHIVVALPARSGLEFEAQEILGQGGPPPCTLVGFQTLPWACRVAEYGRIVLVYGTKRWIGMACLLGDRTEETAQMFGSLLGTEIHPLGSMLALSLANPGQLIHPGIMYGAFGGRIDEIFPREEAVPLFYRNVDGPTAELLSGMSEEVMRIKDRVEGQFPELDLSGVLPLEEWLRRSYGAAIEDASSLVQMFRTNRAYQGLRLPVIRTDGGFRVDLHARYLAEDVPFGLAVTKGVSQILGVATPRIDEVLEAVGRWLGKKYVSQGALAGQGLSETRAPQRFGIQTPGSLLKVYRS